MIFPYSIPAIFFHSILEIFHSILKLSSIFYSKLPDHRTFGRAATHNLGLMITIQVCIRTNYKVWHSQTAKEHLP